MEIIIDSEELSEIATTIDEAVSNNEFLLSAILSLKQNIIEQSLYGLEKDMYEKLEQYETYFSDYYMSTLYTIQDNINHVGETFDEQDIENGKGLI